MYCTREPKEARGGKGRDSELEKTKITLSYSFQPFIGSLI
jgi:hypothetical protein